MTQVREEQERRIGGQRMAEEREQEMGALSAEELAQLSRKREESMRGLSDEEVAEMQRRRSQAMPGFGQTEA
ncbi:hypothetical protein [Nonomuraea aurantiaca]|jgi:hypothetical protein|uniref:hypothetical protein n=1 Tax=Nonomuraea aurantiaca TaxID=2878562 RepID=UPI001CDA3901|nr:hypothetical protein [Nonomuraea aurantiaca]MCA2228859.1 hypothetical protein [Nonomuraea aurantiaca]